MKTTTIPAKSIIDEGVRSGVIDAETLAEVMTIVDPELRGATDGKILGELLDGGVLDTEALLNLAGLDVSFIANNVNRFELELTGDDLVLTDLDATACCGAEKTYVEDVLSCKSCYAEVSL